MYKSLNGIKSLEYTLFPSSVKQGSFLRHGGISKEPFNTFNQSDQVGDRREAFESNRKRLLHFLQMPLVVPNQVHGNSICLVEDPLRQPLPCDGLITNRCGIALAALHADCQVLLLFDPINQAVGIAHAGWRGLVANIYHEIIQAMTQHFQTDPTQLLVAITPSLGPKHAQFVNWKEEFPHQFTQYQIRDAYFDLREIGRQQLLNEGLCEDHIEISKICTFANPQDWYSFRRDKKTGRHLTYIAMR